MKYIKTYENSDEIAYKLNDIVVCSTKNDKFNDYQGYINQNGGFVGGKYITYGRKYKIVDIYYSGYRYNSVPKKFGYGNYKVDIENLKTGKIMQNFYADLFTLESKWIKPDEPMIGDYIIANYEDNFNEDMEEFMNTHIGRYVQSHDGDRYIIQYLNIPRHIDHRFWNTTNPYIKNLGNINLIRNQILYYSDNKAELEEKLKILLKSKNYNL